MAKRAYVKKMHWAYWLHRAVVKTVCGRRVLLEHIAATPKDVTCTVCRRIIGQDREG